MEKELLNAPSTNAIKRWKEISIVTKGADRKPSHSTKSTWDISKGAKYFSFAQSKKKKSKKTEAAPEEQNNDQKKKPGNGAGLLQTPTFS